jgi:hypothetical protein
VATALFAHATPPLRDRIHIDGRDGQFEQDGEFWVDKPRNERLRELGRAQQCSAIGGPVGRYRLEGDRVELVDLYTCGGPVPLNGIYPEFDGPTPATWLTGTFFAKFGYCNDTDGGWGEFQVVKKLTLAEGVVVRMEEQPAVRYERPRYLCYEQ